jgi:Zn-dependent protease
MFSGLDATDIVIILVSIIFSMTIHEAMHGFVAHWLGDDTAAAAGRLTLNPLKHIDLVTTVLLPVVLILVHVPPFFAARPVPFNPYRVKWGEYGAALVGVAGPLTNFALAAIAAIIGRSLITHLTPATANILSLFIEVNIAFFVFNMVPFPPLDGSRLLYAFAPEGLQEIMQRIESMGFLPILIFVLLIFPFIAPEYSSIVTHIYNFLVG